MSFLNTKIRGGGGGAKIFKNFFVQICSKIAREKKGHHKIRIKNTSTEVRLKDVILKGL